MPLSASDLRLEERVEIGTRPDTLDFRDKMFEATLVEVPVEWDLAVYRKHKVPILNQGREGACTGFGLATVANYLLLTRKDSPDRSLVSPRMFYEIAKRYDEWPGEEYSGSSARAAMKGWHKHGVCSENDWPYRADGADHVLTDERAQRGADRPLGAYYRVNHKDIVAMHSALVETGILYASARVHRGWESPGRDGIVKLESEIVGGHAFAIVAYNRYGFWIQNSWSDKWGDDGFGLVTYDDWLVNGQDVWVARLGVPYILRTNTGVSTSRSALAGQPEAYSYQELRPHIISIGNNGKLKESGTYANKEADVANIITHDFIERTRQWGKKRLLLYAHGGLVGETTAVQRLSEYRAALLKHQIYPISFIWHTDIWSTVTSLLKDSVDIRRPERVEGFFEDSLDFMLDRLDDGLEALACALGGKEVWDEMKENALLASQDEKGGARIAMALLAAVLKADPSIELHVVSHSAGAIFHAPIVELLTSNGVITSGPMRGRLGYGLDIKSCTLWAPACTVDLFKQTYMPAIQNGRIKRFALFTLTDKAEQDDHCADIYHKSLLYLVSNALEKGKGERSRSWFKREGTPLVGMEKFVDEEIVELFENHDADWVQAPNSLKEGDPWASGSQQHGDFDDDRATVLATLARILDVPSVQDNFNFHSSRSKLRTRMRMAVR